MILVEVNGRCIDLEGEGSVTSPRMDATDVERGGVGSDIVVPVIPSHSDA